VRGRQPVRAVVVLGGAACLCVTAGILATSHLAAAPPATPVVTGVRSETTPLPPGKQAFLQQEQANAAAAAGAPHAPKPARIAASAPSLAPCPGSSAFRVGLSNDPGHIPGTGVEPTPTRASMLGSNHTEYIVSAGVEVVAGSVVTKQALFDSVDYPLGALVVVALSSDPCSHTVPPDQAVSVHPTPHRGGALTITSMSGDTVSFVAVDGYTGSFNVVTGSF
jgi:hypothetical protein